MMILDDKEVAAVAEVLRSCVDNWPRRIAQLHDERNVEDAHHASRRLHEAEFLLQKLERPSAALAPSDVNAALAAENARLIAERERLIGASVGHDVAKLTEQLAGAMRELVTVRRLLEARDAEIERLRAAAGGS